MYLDCLDALDQKILTLLTQNARYSYSEIGELVGLSRVAVKGRIDALEKKGYSFASAEIEQIPQTTVTLTDEKDLLFMGKLIDSLEDNDDVQSVWHNWEE